MNSVRIDSKIKISSSLFIQLMRYIASLNIDVSSLKKDCSFKNGVSDFIEGRIPLIKYLEIEEEAVRITGDNCFGLHTGEFAEPGSWSILGYIMMNCNSLEESILKLQRYSQVVGNLFKITIESRDETSEIVISTATGNPVPSRHCLDATLSSFIRIIRYLTGKQIIPIQVEISFENPDRIDEYHRIFQSPVHFNAKETKIIFLRKDLSQKIIHSDQSLLNYFEKYANEILTSMDPSVQFTKKVTELVLKKLEEEDLSIQSIAEDMGISVRMLQLRLKDEGKIFRTIVREAKETLARKYLRENFPVEEISYLLGFSEPSVFRRVFKKWSGLTPGEFKKRGLENSNA